MTMRWKPNWIARSTPPRRRSTSKPQPTLDRVPDVRFFYDTEFIDNGRTIELISIGVAAEDGREYYAGSTEFSRRAGGPLGAHPRAAQTAAAVVAAVALAAHIREELEEFFGIDGDEPIELWAWVAAYDHVALCQLWGPMTICRRRSRGSPGNCGSSGRIAAPRGCRRGPGTPTTRWSTPGTTCADSRS